MKEILEADITEYSTFKLPSHAKRLVILESKEDVEEFFTKDPAGVSGDYYLIGGGSNTLLSPNIECVVQLHLIGIEWGAVTTIGASEDWDKVVQESVRMGYSGLEPLVAIPGTVGAAPVQNIGAYGREFADVSESVFVFDKKEGKFKTLKKEECEFGYRNSIFKKDKNRYIIISVRIVLDKTEDTRIPTYAGVDEAVQSLMKERGEEKVTSRILCDAITGLRWSKLPRPEGLPNVGSCFENPVIEAAKANELKIAYPSMPLYPLKTSDKVKVSAGWLIDECGLKGAASGGISIYQDHALVLTNPEGKGSIEDVTTLVSTIKKAVLEKFGIELVLEPNVVV